MPQDHLDAVASLQPLRHLLRQIHGAMLSTRAAKRNHQILEAAALIFEHAGIHQRKGAGEKLVDALLLVEVLDHRSVLAGEGLELRLDLLAVMGGLGPTEDDLSREAVAEALGVSIRRDPQQVVALAARFAKSRIQMTDNNLKQADIIEGAKVIPNVNGSAPGLWLNTSFAGHRKLVMLVPGPPSECKPLFANECIPRLRAVLPNVREVHMPAGANGTHGYVSMTNAADAGMALTEPILVSTGALCKVKRCCAIKLVRLIRSNSAPFFLARAVPHSRRPER